MEENISFTLIDKNHRNQFLREHTVPMIPSAFSYVVPLRRPVQFSSSGASQGGYEPQKALSS